MAGAAHGGAEAFFERLTIALHADGVQQSLVIRDAGGRADRLKSAGLVVTTLPFSGKLDVYTPWQLRRRAQTCQPSHILAWMNRGASMAPKVSGVPLIARLGGYYNLKYYQRCDYLIGNTPDIVRYLRESGWPEEKLAYLPNFASPPRPDNTITTPPRNKPVVLAMGRLHRNKGFDTLIAAMTQIPDAQLWLLGEGEDAAALQRQAAGQDVLFLPWQENITPYMMAADVFVCPSRHEPLGNVMLDAMAHQKPIVATASAGALHLLQHRETALITPIDDAPALAQAIQDLLHDHQLAESLASQAHAAYLGKFSSHAVVAQYKTFLEHTRHG